MCVSYSIVRDSDFAKSNGTINSRTPPFGQCPILHGIEGNNGGIIAIDQFQRKKAISPSPRAGAAYSSMQCEAVQGDLSLP